MTASTRFTSDETSQTLYIGFNRAVSGPIINGDSYSSYTGADHGFVVKAGTVDKVITKVEWSSGTITITYTASAEADLATRLIYTPNALFVIKSNKDKTLAAFDQAVTRN